MVVIVGQLGGMVCGAHVVGRRRSKPTPASRLVGKATDVGKVLAEARRRQSQSLVEDGVVAVVGEGVQDGRQGSRRTHRETGRCDLAGEGTIVERGSWKEVAKCGSVEFKVFILRRRGRS